ncbi:MAG: hypothetical protein NVSMB52_19440 [Chloroflexota bacterium]
MHATLTAFRKQRAAGQLVSPEPSAKRIRKPSAEQRGEIAEHARRVMQLERENRKLARQLEQAQVVIEVQKKVSRLLELSLDDGRKNS